MAQNKKLYHIVFCLKLQIWAQAILFTISHIPFIFRFTNLTAINLSQNDVTNKSDLLYCCNYLK